MKHRRVQTAYKRLLVEKLSENEERQKMLLLRKEKIKFYQERNALSFEDFIKQSMHIKSTVALKEKRGGGPYRDAPPVPITHHDS